MDDQSRSSTELWYGPWMPLSPNRPPPINSITSSNGLYYCQTYTGVRNPSARIQQPKNSGANPERPSLGDTSQRTYYDSYHGGGGLHGSPEDQRPLRFYAGYDPDRGREQYREPLRTFHGRSHNSERSVDDGRNTTMTNYRVRPQRASSFDIATEAYGRDSRGWSAVAPEIVLSRSPSLSRHLNPQRGRSEEIGGRQRRDRYSPSPHGDPSPAGGGRQILSTRMEYLGNEEDFNEIRDTARQYSEEERRHGSRGEGIMKSPRYTEGSSTRSAEPRDRRLSVPERSRNSVCYHGECAGYAYCFYDRKL